MNGFFKTILAGYGAKKLGGGCLTTIIIFVLIEFSSIYGSKTTITAQTTAEAFAYANAGYKINRIACT